MQPEKGLSRSHKRSSLNKVKTSDDWTTIFWNVIRLKLHWKAFLQQTVKKSGYFRLKVGLTYKEYAKSVRKPGISLDNTPEIDN